METTIERRIQMPKKRNSELMKCRYFSWRLTTRNGVWQADARSNSMNAGRHSLGTRDEAEARQLVHELDEIQASKLGLIDRIPTRPKDGFTVTKGIELFRAHKRRPKSVGGVAESTYERYNPILKKFESFATEQRIQYASQITRAVFDQYVEMLEEREFKLSTIVTEMTLVKSLHQFWIDEKKLDTFFAIKYPLNRPTQSLTYCPSPQEVEAILSVCHSEPSLTWLWRIVTVLAYTGLRFGEARDLEWRDIDRDYEFLQVRDETFQKPANGKKVRKTKTRKSRSLPLHCELVALLKTIPRSDATILVGPRGGELRSDVFGDTLRTQVFPAVIAEVGNEDLRRLTAHGFRHYFVSWCANHNAPQLSVMNWLGHSTQRMTNYYFHSNDAASLSHMRQLEAAEAGDQR